MIEAGSVYGCYAAIGIIAIMPTPGLCRVWSAAGEALALLSGIIKVPRGRIKHGLVADTVCTGF